MCVKEMMAKGAFCAVLMTVGETGAIPSFVLPDRIYAAPGLELNVYFSDVFDSVVPQNYAFQAYCKKGRSQLERWCFTPTKEDAGKEYELVINAWNDDGLVAAVTSQVRVAAAPVDPAKKVTLALLGDSLTNCGYQDQIFKVMREAGYSGYTPIGSRAPAPDRVKHDGYGGYSFNTFLTWYTVTDDEFDHVQDAAEREQLKSLGVPVKIIHEWQRDLLRSPLVKFEKGQKIVDIPRWLGKINDGKAPDIVLVELGVNSVFSYRGEPEELRVRIRKAVLPEMERFMSRLRQDMPDSIYLLCTQPVGTTQDGFAENYGSAWNAVQHRKIVFALNREFDAWVKGKNDSRLLLLPLGHAVDPVDGFIFNKQQASARSEREISRAANAVHPSAIGGHQIGDAAAAMLMDLMSKTR